MMTDLKKTPLIILDFGSQYTQLIARRVREMGVYCEIHPFNAEIDIIQGRRIKGIILSGGPANAAHHSSPRAPLWIFTLGVPLLGICYGMQVMALQLGGQVAFSTLREFGYAQLHSKNNSPLLANIEDRVTPSGDILLDVWMSHGDKVTALPPHFNVICETANAPIAGMADDNRKWYGLQFHPEVTHTIQGMSILKRFVIDICKSSPNWTSSNIVEQAVRTIQAQVGNDLVILGLSGGVDSCVVAALLHKAIGKQLTAVFVDTGLLRAEDSDLVMSTFARHLDITIININAKEKFLKILENVTCPEKKRKFIGKAFIDIFQEKAAELPEVKWLAQGTIYPDVIESAAFVGINPTAMIKSHHNVGGLPDSLSLKLLEPLRELFKDEVREMGLTLGLPYDMVYRHPFPGPGLGIRILGEVKQEYVDILRKADAIFIEELHLASLYHKVSQAFAVFLPVKTVGVMGDERRYDYVICLRAVETVDFMTAKWAHLPWDFLAHVSTRIINEVPKVSRVTYDISSKPPATIEWE